MDANAKLGFEVIPNDPNPQSKNGLMLWSLIQRNNLHVVNATDLCEGVITRHRITKVQEEKAVLDYIIVCDELFKHVTKMIVDEERCDVLTKYASKTGRGKVVMSDHNLLSCSFDLKYSPKPKECRVEVFNFKNEDAQKRFLIETSKKHLSCCFTPNKTADECANLFKKTLNKTVHKCFKKVRVSRKTDTILEEKMKLRDQLKLESTCANTNTNIITKLTLAEQDIQQHCASENALQIKEQVKGLCNLSGGFSANGLWKVKKKVINKQTDPPMAKKDSEGNLVTTPAALKNLYRDEYIHRLRHRDINPDLSLLKELKEDLWARRFNLLRQMKSPDWSSKQVTEVLSTLDVNKARDPLGYSNIIFKPGVCGPDLIDAITNLANFAKRDMCSPVMMQLTNISTIYKNKGSRFDLVNDRGIFNMVTFRKIVDRLIYNDKYAVIDENMSDSNVGGRKGRNIRNHLFIVYGVINSVTNNESPPIDIQLYDMKQCFDAMWLEESMNDLCDTIPEKDWDDKLAMIYQSNSKNLVAVKTPFGLTERTQIDEIVTQGGVWGPIQCSNQVDCLGKECLNRNIHLYTYKNTVKIMPLAMIDDVLGMAPCGIKSTAMNTYINCKIEMNKSTFNESKCKQIHVGNPNPYCPELEVHGHEFSISTHEKYLGDFVSSTIARCNTKNIEYRRSKGLGIVSQIMVIINSVSLGYFLFDVACVLRETLLINGILYNSEVWYGVTAKQVEELENIDKLMLRKLFDTCISTPSEALYLELGLIPIRFILKGRRLMFLHYLLQLEENDMLHRFFLAQWEKPGNNDWVLTVKQDIIDLDMGLKLADIKLCSRNKFKGIVRESCCTVAFNFLIEKKKCHSKLSRLSYNKLNMQSYLKDGVMGSHDSRLLFLFRTRMVDVGENFKNYHGRSPLCPLCKEASDDQEHLLLCPKIHDGGTIPNTLYSDIFTDDTTKMAAVIKPLRDALSKREALLSSVE